MVPIGLVLGFFIDIIIERWWSQFQTLTWPDEIAMLLCATVSDVSIANLPHGHAKHQMHKIMRYLNLAFAICLRDFVATARRRFPAMQSILAEGKY